MTKKLLFLFLILSGITLYQSKVIGNSKPMFFCDNLAPTNFQITNITQSSVSVSWALDPNTPDYILRIRPVGSFAWLSSPLQTNSLGNYTFSELVSCTNYEIQVSKVCVSQGNWTASLSFTTLSNGICSLAINEIQRTPSINIYPNPVSGILSIAGISSESDFEIYNLVGQKVSSGKTSDNKVNVHKLLKGIYFIKIKDKIKENRLKFIKK